MIYKKIKNITNKIQKCKSTQKSTHSLALQIINLLSQVQENCSADEARLIDKVLEFLKREGLYSPQMKEIRTDDPIATDLIGALLTVRRARCAPQSFHTLLVESPSLIDTLSSCRAPVCTRRDAARMTPSSAQATLHVQPSCPPK